MISKGNLLTLAFLFLYITRQYVIGKGEEDRNSKLLPLFTVIKFPNTQCAADNGLNGTCLLASECQTLNGVSSGQCAEGYGTCCIIILRCNEQSSENSTYFVSQGNESGICSIRICPKTDNICQLRLDFNQFVIAGPSTTTLLSTQFVKGVGSVGQGKSFINLTPKTQCNVDSFSITTPETTAPPIICGMNTGQHMIVGAGSGTCNELVMHINNLPGLSIWQIKIDQFECDSPVLAPQGCTKYFYGSPFHCMMTYNYDGGLHLANQEDVMCLRRERHMCAACYTTISPEDFDVTSMEMKGIVITGNDEQCCGYGNPSEDFHGYDCLVIPGGLFADQRMTKFPPVNEFCGRLKGIFGLNTTVCTKSTPYRITFVSDGYEVIENEAQVNGKGFRICSYQLSC